MAVGLVDQGSLWGGGKIWQRGRPRGGAVAVVLAAVVAAVVLTAAAVVSTAAAEDQGQHLVGLLVGLVGDD